MSGRIRRLRNPVILAVVAPIAVIVVLVQLALTSQAAVTSSAGWVTPKSTNELDCNGWSAKYTTARPNTRSLCTDPTTVKDGKHSRFIDNGWYVGHDEPSVKFISHAAGSGNTMSYDMQLPVDPTSKPTASGSVTSYAELSIAPWFGLPICDPESYPQNACKPDSDRNTGMGAPTDAGSAFMELQLYPPGFAPWVDSESCSATQWCGAITIDSLMCSYNFVSCNPNCEEPVNFAFLQMNGVPAGPPSPQLFDISSQIPNAQTLMMNSGDVLQLSVTDPAAGLTTSIRDVTTGQTGYMTASAANGFMNTRMSDCKGHPFTFHAEYNSARQQNQVPWAALEGGVLMEQEVGHFESCNAVTYKNPIKQTGFKDESVYQTCVGGQEGKKSVGEGPCSYKTGLCRNASTEGTTGPQACPTNNPATGALCEFSDALCFPKGDRTVEINGTPGKETSSIAHCNDNWWQNGDLDFDGMSYAKGVWPNGSSDHPTTFRYVGPFDKQGNTYPTVQFESDAPGSEFLCNTAYGTNCQVPPLGADFYPYWSLNNSQTLNGISTPPGACVWNFGDTIKDVTTNDLGKDTQYGTPNLARYGGTVISSPEANPEFSGDCAPATS
ncbi:MAG TPA: hypothetical protein VEM41_09120 [Actinomycetota bacterium]|nr:hypothetical protein [Actinomycetota bacterium]